MLAAQRYEELLELLAMAPYDLWHYRQFGVQALAEVESSLDRKISPTMYTKKEFADRRAAGNPFLSRVLEGEHLVLIGSESDTSITR